VSERSDAPSESGRSPVDGTAADASTYKLYTELASWWPLMSAPSEYAEEAGVYRRALVAGSRRPVRTLLELGSGGGNNASHLAPHFESMTLVDLSPGMLEVSRGLNPVLEHHQGDLRTVRLAADTAPGASPRADRARAAAVRRFDAVLVHDAVMYMTTEDDLRRAMETAFVHCEPGGAALFCPDCVRETFHEEADMGGHDGDGRSMRWVSWCWDDDPADTLCQVEYVYLLCESGAAPRVVRERHQEGLFARDVWLRLLEEVGFEASMLPFEHSEIEPGTVELFLGQKPPG
jgi:SAM-dependent methyltransferase